MTVAALLFVVFIVTLISCYCFMRIAEPLGLIAYPGEHRQHDGATPLVGGIAIFIGLVCGVMVLANDATSLLPSLLLLCLAGVIDDRFKLPSWSRFVVQALAVLLMIEYTGVQLTSLGFLVSTNELALNTWSVPLTVFACIGVINAVNMSDGMDGLAGSLLLLVLIALALKTDSHHELILVTGVSIIGFLVWNLRLFRSNAAVFMGDAGSTMLGLVMAFLLISATQSITPAAQSELRPVSALWLLALPLFDAVSVLLLRPLRGQSPFSADRIHYHHLFERLGWSVNGRLLCILFAQSTFIFIGYSIHHYGVAESYQFCAFLICFLMYFFILSALTKNTQKP